MKSIKKVLFIGIISLISIFAFNIDAKAATVICIYYFDEGNFNIYADYTSKFIRKVDNADLMRVFETKMDGLTLKTDKWNFKCSDGTEPCCPKIYYNRMLNDRTGHIEFKFSPYSYSAPSNIPGESVTNEKTAGGGIGKLNSDNGTSVTPNTQSSQTPTSTSENEGLPECGSFQKELYAEMYREELKNIQQKYEEMNNYFATHSTQEEEYQMYLGNGYDRNGFAYSGYSAEVDYAMNKALTNLQNGYQERLKCIFDESFIDMYISKLNAVNTEWSSKLETTINTKAEQELNSGTITESQMNSITSSASNQTERSIEKVETTVEKYMTTFREWTELNKGTAIDESCRGILDSKLVDRINQFMTWIRIAVPILLIILGMIDFGKAVMFEDNSSNSELSKAVRTFTKRCIIAVAIFFVPTIISFLVDVFNNVSDYPLTDLPNCGIK